MNTASAHVFTLPEREFQQGISEMLVKHQYRGVLNAVGVSREKDPKNIFLIAVDRQVRRMEEMIATANPDVEERQKIEQSLPLLIQRAWADAASRGIVLTIPASAPAPVPPPVAGPAVTAESSGPKKADFPYTLQRPEKDVPAMAGRRRSGLAIAAAGLVILLLGLAATFVVQQEPEAPAEVAVGAHAPAAEIPPAVVKPQAKAAEEAIAVAATPSTTTTPEVVPPRQPQPVTPSPEAVTEKEKSVPERPAPAEPDARRSSGKGVTQEPVQVQAAAPKETVVQVPASDAPAEPFVPVQKEPRVVRLVKPEVGPAVLKLGGTGEVIAQVLIGVDGKPRKVRILKSTNELLNEAVATALLGSEFEPGVMTTGPVESWLTVPFKFR